MLAVFKFGLARFMLQNGPYGSAEQAVSRRTVCIAARHHGFCKYKFTLFCLSLPLCIYGWPMQIALE